jgi:cupin 2 domain-containing protein
MNTTNIFKDIPRNLDSEFFDVLIQKNDVKIERIVSKGHSSPESGWYDQAQDEWVIILQGEAIITFEDSEDVRLGMGDHINIPAHTKHKVSWTPPQIETIWIAVFYGATNA